MSSSSMSESEKKALEWSKKANLLLPLSGQGAAKDIYSKIYVETEDKEKQNADFKGLMLLDNDNELFPSSSGSGRKELSEQDKRKVVEYSSGEEAEQGENSQSNKQYSKSGGGSEEGKKQSQEKDGFSKPSYMPGFVDEKIRENRNEFLQLGADWDVVHPVAKKFLGHALQGEGKELYFDNNSYVAHAICYSEEFKNHMRRVMGDKLKASDYNVERLKGESSDGEFNQDEDLYLAIAKYKLKIDDAQSLSDGRVRLKLTLQDKYDFDEIRKNKDGTTGIGNYLNNLGYLEQKSGGLKAFPFKVEFEYVYDPNETDEQSNFNMID